MKIKNEFVAYPTKGEFAYIPDGDLRTLAKPIGSMKEMKNNPRRNDIAAQELARLIRKNGFRKPIVINQDGEIKAGHTAYKAARLLGMKMIPAVQSAWNSEKKEWDYVISDNRSNENSNWDKDILNRLMQQGLLDKKLDEDGKYSSGFSEKELISIEELHNKIKENDVKSDDLLPISVEKWTLKAVKNGEDRVVLSSFRHKKLVFFEAVLVFLDGKRRTIRFDARSENEGK